MRRVLPPSLVAWKLPPVLAAALLAACLLAQPSPAARPTCAGKQATIVGTPGDDVIVSKHRDVIWAGGGDDVIRAQNGSDVVCAGPGNDVVYGGRGIDRIYGGAGNDRIYGQQGTDFLRGGRGRDTILGQRGTDWIRGGGGRDTLLGGAGNDRIRGGGGDRDLLLGGSGDDRLDGGPGDADHVYGGLGADRVDGGPGDADLLRGDEGHDRIDGGGGRRDVVSFATATPPGAAALGSDGVHVDLRRGIAYGDGFGLGPTHGIDRLRRVDDVIGSPFDDQIVGNGGSRIEGGYGADVVSGGTELSRRVHPRAGRGAGVARTSVGFAAALDGNSALHVVGSSGPDRIAVSAAGGAIVVADPAGLTTDAPACALDPSGTVATCAPGGGIDTLVVHGGHGADAIRLDRSLPRTLAGYVSGGPGDDSIRGGPGDDLLDSGSGRADVVAGGGGDDSLQGESRGVLLRGGRGDDLMVVSRPCRGEVLRGGPGGDRAAFNPAPRPVFAKLGGRISSGERCEPGRIAADVENLEGTRYADTLVGDRGRNSILGRKGADTLLGSAGRDTLEGGPGRDRCRGGSGRDRARSCERRAGIP